MLKITIVTIPGMIEEKDWQKLSKLAEVNYIEKDNVTQDQLLDLIKSTDYLMLNYDVIQTLDENFYKIIKDKNYPLKAISTDITGVGWAKPQVADKYGIPLLQIPHYSTISVAEFTIMSLLMLVKKINLTILDRVENKQAQVRKNDVLYKKTLGVIGVGNIGMRVIELAKGFDMNILAWNRTPKKIIGGSAVSLEELFKKSDYISLHLKTVDKTKEIIDKKLFSLSKPGLIIINQADGKLVNNDDLLECIKSGKIAGYSCSSEAVKGHGLEKEPNVLVLPPQAWFTDLSLNRLKEVWVENILNAIDNKYPNIVKS